jgi:hypothetical protein
VHLGDVLGLQPGLQVVEFGLVVFDGARGEGTGGAVDDEGGDFAGDEVRNQGVILGGWLCELCGVSGKSGGVKVRFWFDTATGGGWLDLFWVFCQG